MPRPGRILFADSLSSVNKMQVLFVKEPPYTSQPYIFPSKRLNTQGREQLGNSRKEGQWHPELFNINITEDYLFKSSLRPSLGLWCYPLSHCFQGCHHILQSRAENWLICMTEKKMLPGGLESKLSFESNARQLTAQAEQTTTPDSHSPAPGYTVAQKLPSHIPTGLTETAMRPKLKSQSYQEFARYFWLLAILWGFEGDNGSCVVVVIWQELK